MSARPLGPCLLSGTPTQMALLICGRELTLIWLYWSGVLLRFPQYLEANEWRGTQFVLLWDEGHCLWPSVGGVTSKRVVVRRM